MTRDRGVSAALDAALCLLLVSAAVVTVVTVAPPRDPGPETARRGAALLGATTATVRYEHVRYGNLSARGTLATLLADAVVLRARDREAVSGFTASVWAATRRALDELGGGDRVQVVARWRPYPEAPVGTTLSVGADPPAASDVRAVQFAVPLNETLSTEAALEAATSGGYERLAARIVERSGARVPGGAADTIRRDMARRFESPHAAARALTLDRVRIVVRTWSA